MGRETERTSINLKAVYIIGRCKSVNIRFEKVEQNSFICHINRMFLLPPKAVSEVITLSSIIVRRIAHISDFTIGALNEP